MKSIQDYYSHLPLTFQHIQIEENTTANGQVQPNNEFTVKSYGSEAVLRENFHRPISKIVTLDGIE